MAAPQILVLMVQVRILAAELFTRRGGRPGDRLEDKPRKAGGSAPRSDPEGVEPDRRAEHLPGHYDTVWPVGYCPSQNRSNWCIQRRAGRGGVAQPRGRVSSSTSVQIGWNPLASRVRRTRASCSGADPNSV